jgi:serine phosphatase RsbU (regulator of sigma subunit)
MPMTSVEQSMEVCPPARQRAPHAFFKRHCGYSVGGFTLPVPPSAAGGDSIGAVRVRDGFVVFMTDGAGKGECAAGLGRIMHRSVCSAIASGISNPADIVRRLNRVMYRERTFGAAVILHCNSERVAAAAAGAPAPAVFHEGRMETLAAAGTILGYSICPELDVVARDVPRGAFIALYSDGITDAENGRDELFDPERFAGILDGGESVASNLLQCVDAVLKHCGEQQDDLSMVVLRADAPRRRG